MATLDETYSLALRLQNLKADKGVVGGDLAGALPGPTVIWANGYTIYDARYSLLAHTHSYAPVSGAYVTIGADATLTGERALVGTANQITVTDGGANGNVTLATPQNIHTGATPTFGGLTLNGAGSIVGSADVVQFAVKAHSTQTANLQEWRRNSDAAAISYFDPSGNLYLFVPSGSATRKVVIGGSGSNNATISYSNATALLSIGGSGLGALDLVCGGRILEMTPSGDLFFDKFGIDINWVTVGNVWVGLGVGMNGNDFTLEANGTPGTYRMNMRLTSMTYDLTFAGTAVITYSNSGETFADGKNIILGTTTGTKIGTATTQKLAFWNATPVVQQTLATLTNNVTSGGTTDVIANYTDLIIYANAAAAIRNNIYQLARKQKQMADLLQTLGLGA